jgi:hypothetical protein
MTMSEIARGPSGSPGTPVVVRGRLEEPLSRGLWLVKWLLLIPHYIVLAFLYLAFGVVTVVAFFAILFTGRYPRGLFGFNLGVLRWSWRVSYYGYSALGTDRYPPFSLGEEPDYPATLSIAYPEHLSRGLVLVKWWLLAIPQYILLGLVAGGTSYTVTTVTGASTTWTIAGGSLLGVMVLFAGVGLLFTARYPRGLYDFAMGLNRWVLRVVAYVTLMTDDYPPFRLDQGGADPAEPSGPMPAGPGGAAQSARRGVPATAPAAPAAPGGGASGGGGRTGAVVALVVGLLVGLVGIGLAAVGTGGLWLQSRRDAAGFVSTNGRVVTTQTAAITAEDVDLDLGGGASAWVSSDRFGTVRVRAAAADGSPIFIGIAPQSAIDTWLAPVAHDELRDIDEDSVTYLRHAGQPTAAAPTSQTFWSAQTGGPGAQELQWQVRSGRWGVVLARPDGTPGIQARVDVGAAIPGLTGLSTGLLIAGLVLLAGGTVLVVVGAVRLSSPRPGGGGRRSTGQPYPPAPRPAAPEESRPAPATSARETAAGESGVQGP